MSDIHQNDKNIQIDNSWSNWYHPILYMTKDKTLSNLFSPKSVAIIGASADYRKVGHLVAKNMILQGYSGNMFFVNVKGEEILGRKSYKSFADLPEVVDVAVFATPASITLNEIEKNSHRFRSAVILAAGFKEEHHKAAEENELRLQKIINEGKTIFLGPNCAGFANPLVGANATFLPGPIPKGNIAFVSQSGALGSVMIDYLSDRPDAGFSFFASLGNKSQLTESEVLEYLANDDATKVVAMYLEDVKDGENFLSALTKVSLKKPVVIYKSGSSTKGAAAAVSHTGSLAGDDAVFSAAITQCGAIRVETIQEFFGLIEIYAHGMAPKRDDFIVITNAGGGGVIAADTIEKYELQLSKWNINSEGKVEIALNPFDVRGDADAQKFIDAISHTKDEKVGGVIVIVTPQANTQIEDTAKAISGISSALPHPVYPMFLGKWSQDQATRILQHNNLPSFSSVEILVRALKKVVLRNKIITAMQENPNSVIGSAANQSYSNKTSEIVKNERVLTLSESYDLMQANNIPMLPYYLVNSHEELEALKSKIKYPAVAKVSSEKLTHKTDGGGLVLNICTFDEMKGHYQKFFDRGFNTILVMQQISGLEFLFGAKRDVTFGPVMVFGLGGIMTNHLKQVVQLVAPIEKSVFEQIINNSPLKTFLPGFRGFSPVTVDRLYEILVSMQNIMLDDPTVTEIDLNPVIFGRDGSYLGVDARIVKKG
ncbi:MAG: acetate--CoA ligase family protein [Patescibacteria group bacterium]